MTLASGQGSEPVVVAAVVFGLGATWLAIGRWGWTLSTYPVSAGPALRRGRMIGLVAGSALILLLGVLSGWLFGWAPEAFAAIGAG